jgi:ribosomal protein L25 (general stress protein Ctc)
MKKEFDGNVYDDGKELTLSLKIAAKELSKFLKS